MHHAGSVFEPVVQDNYGMFKILVVHGGKNEKSDGRTAAKVDNKLPTLPCWIALKVDTDGDVKFCSVHRGAK